MNIFSFFKFYYYVIKKSPKKYDIAMDSTKSTITFATPLVLMVLYLIATIPVSVITTSPTLSLLGALWIPLTAGNAIFVMHVADEGHDIQLAEQRKREEMERLQREIEWERQRQEKEYERMREERERLWREFIYRYPQQNQDRNMQNAMHLLGLEDGFTKKDVRAAYRKMSKIHHPDVGGLEENFKRLNKAYKYIMERL